VSHIHALIAIALASALLVTGCGGSGYSTQEANEICKDEQSRSGTADEEALKLCIVCFETCTNCTPQGTTPETYACPYEE
jgi:hypothetical protein